MLNIQQSSSLFAGALMQFGKTAARRAHAVLAYLAKRTSWLWLTEKTAACRCAAMDWNTLWLSLMKRLFAARAIKTLSKKYKKTYVTSKSASHDLSHVMLVWDEWFKALERLESGLLFFVRSWAFHPQGNLSSTRGSCWVRTAPHMPASAVCGEVKE